jgi:hypothetical protein
MEEGGAGLVEDPYDFAATWGGSARMLLQVMNLLKTDTRARVPVQGGRKAGEPREIAVLAGLKSVSVVYTENGPALYVEADADRLFALPLTEGAEGAAPGEGLKPPAPFTGTVETFADDDPWIDRVVLEPGKVTTHPGGPTFEIKEPVVSELPRLLKVLRAEVVDMDQDNRLDLLVWTAAGPRILRNVGEGRFDLLVEPLGELDYHTRTMPPVAGMFSGDFNQDGFTDVGVLFTRQVAPALFFNRGAGTFGLARDLMLTGVEDLKSGVVAGTFADVDGDGLTDLVLGTAEGRLLWLPFTTEAFAGPGVAVLASGPVLVTAVDQEKALGVAMAGPAQPAVFYLQEPGPLQLRWTDLSGDRHEKEVIAEEGVQLITLP